MSMEKIENMENKEKKSGKDVILFVEDLTKHFPVGRQSFTKHPKTVKAVNNVYFKLRENEVLAIVGESGCGKSTTGRAAMRLIEPTSGRIYYRGEDIMKYSNSMLKKFRSKMQMVFQDPYSSLNPRITVGALIEECLTIHHMCDSREERHDRAMEMLKKVGIREDQYYRYPHEFSGGQRQRIGLARALIVNPEIVVCDEPVSALDVSIQSQVLNLMKDMQQEYKLSYIFISHDMSVVRYISDRVAVMYLGYIVEEAPTEVIFENPTHPYTQALLSAIPEANPHVKRERIVLNGEIPSPLNPPKGCPFHDRCKYATDICKEKMPERKKMGKHHYVSCHKYSE